MLKLKEYTLKGAVLIAVTYIILGIAMAIFNFIDYLTLNN